MICPNCKRNVCSCKMRTTKDGKTRVCTKCQGAFNAKNK